MASFTDSQGREWSIELDAPKLDAIRSHHKIDLTSFEAPGLLAVYSDEVLLAKVVWEIVETAAGGKKCNKAEFFRSLRGDSLSDAYEALKTEVFDFLPSGKRATLEAVLAHQEMLLTEGSQLLVTEGCTEEQRKLALDEIRQTFNLTPSTPSNGLTSSPDSAESRPEA